MTDADDEEPDAEDAPETRDEATGPEPDPRPGVPGDEREPEEPEPEDEEDPATARPEDEVPETDEELIDATEERIEEADAERADAEEAQAASPEEPDPDRAPTGDPEGDGTQETSPPRSEDGIEDAEVKPVPEDGEQAEPGPEIPIEEASMEPLDAESDAGAFHEPGIQGSDEGPRTPTKGALSVVEGMESGAGDGEETRRPRRGLQAADLEEAIHEELGEPITTLPPVEGPHVEVVDLAPIREELTYVRVLFDQNSSRHLYEVIEPPLTEEEAENLAFLRETLVQTLEVREAERNVDWSAHLLGAVREAIEEHGVELSPVTEARIQYYLERDFLGYGPIDVMMQDPMVEDISCDGPDIPLYVYHREHGSVRTNVTFPDEDELDAYVRSLAQRSGRHISIAEPILDATLPDTSRLQATLSKEVTTRGSSFTIRRFRADPFTAPDLVRLGTMNARMAAWLWMAVETGAPTLVVGGTASGKTTTLSAMTQFVPPAKKVVTIEDTREFSLVHENWVASLTRAGGFGADQEREIDMYKLLRTALRQRPEYLIVGEVRGSEAQTLFQAMATGHATYSTMHADSAASAVHRLENPPIDVPRMMLGTLDAIVVQGQTRVGGHWVRRILGITEIAGIDDATGDVLTNQVYDWKASDDSFRFQGRSNVLEDLRVRRNVSVDEIEKDWEQRTQVIEWMVEQGIRHIDDVAKIVAAYYASPERLLARIGSQAGQPQASSVEHEDRGEEIE